MMEQRQLALRDLAMKNINSSQQYLCVNKVLFNHSCYIEIETKPTLENLDRVQSILTVVSGFDAKIGSELTDCEELSNLIYLSLALHFTDSRINVVIEQNEHIRLSTNYSNQSKNQGK